ncbi:MAG: TolC family protein [Planctomycetota bacterium]
MKFRKPHRPRRIWIVPALVLLTLSANFAQAQRVFPTLFPEERTIQVRDPSQLPRYQIPNSGPPSTVSNPQPELEPVKLSLDSAIRIALDNSEVVRVLAGTTATTSGQTIYDVAATNTTIDQQNARFDPTLTATNTFNRLENPQAIFDPINPGQSLITGQRNDSFNSTLSLAKQNALGGTLGFDFNATPSRTSPSFSPLNPLTRSSTDVNYTQPLLQGGRIGPNLAPIVLARIDTERSYFQFKDSVQELVRGVIDAYWTLVAARTDVWARRRQVEQLAEAVKRLQAQVRAEQVNRADLAQAEFTLKSFQANLVASEANVIQREAVLRNILGIPPVDGRRLIPNSPPNNKRFYSDWAQILELAAERRPDLIELKLIVEADEQQLVIARNNALPRLDAQALYRWNGLEGIVPNGTAINSSAGAHTDWTVGVNFSVPLGLRLGRASLRQRELIIARDRANLHQGLHSSGHQLAGSVRSLDQLYDQYEAYREARKAARVNLDAQLLRYRTHQTILLNVLQALTDWGNTVSLEAATLTQYNTLLATLERQTGTILETHGVVFYEERFGSIGPLGRFFPDESYPQDLRPTPNNDFYENSDQPAEDAFDLQAPNFREKLQALPYDNIELPKSEPLFPDVPENAVPQSDPLSPDKPLEELPPARPLPAPPQEPGTVFRANGTFVDQAVQQSAYRSSQQALTSEPETTPVPAPTPGPAKRPSLLKRAKSWLSGTPR